VITYMINLVKWCFNRCIGCKSTGTLQLYRGSKPVKDQAAGPDRLVCSKCGRQYAISLDNMFRTPEPLDDPTKLNQFMRKFVG
jgi:hypothetical protein